MLKKIAESSIRKFQQKYQKRIVISSQKYLNAKKSASLQLRVYCKNNASLLQAKLKYCKNVGKTVATMLQNCCCNNATVSQKCCKNIEKHTKNFLRQYCRNATVSLWKCFFNITEMLPQHCTTVATILYSY